MQRTVKFGGNPLPLVGTEVKVGDKAKNFTCLGMDLKPVSLDQYAGKVKIVSVYPSIDTSVCSMQAGKFNAEASKLGDKVVILSISNDLPFALGRYCGAEGIKNLVMLSDHRLMDFGQQYGFVLEPLRLLARGVVVIGADDVVRHVEYVSEVTHEPNYDAALKVVKSLM